MGRGYGHDTVNANDSTAGKRDVVCLTGLTLDDVELLSKAPSGSYADVLIIIKDTGEVLTIEKAYAPSLASNSYSMRLWSSATGRCWNGTKSSPAA